MEMASRDRSARDLSLPAILREGAVGGVVGAVALAAWFLVMDTLAGQPLLTPALLGARLFQGAGSAGAAGLPEPAGWLIVGYSIVHALAFIAAGLMIAQALAIFERTPPLLIPGFFVLLVFFELVYYTYVLAVVEPALATLNWPSILIGNLIAVLAMGGYFWRSHPDLLRRVARG